MKNKLIFGGTTLAFLLLMAITNKTAHASSCESRPEPLRWNVGSAEYIASWHVGEAPRIYFNVGPFDHRRSIIVAEFDVRFNVWLFHSYVDDGFIKDVHRHWRRHRRHYRRCMGYSAEYYYKPYYPHYNYRWFKRQHRYRKYARPHAHGNLYHPHVSPPYSYGHHHNVMPQQNQKPRRKLSPHRRHQNNSSANAQPNHQKPKRHHQKRKKRRNKRQHRR